MYRQREAEERRRKLAALLEAITRAPGLFGSNSMGDVLATRRLVENLLYGNPAITPSSAADFFP